MKGEMKWPRQVIVNQICPQQLESHLVKVEVTVHLNKKWKEKKMNTDNMTQEELDIYSDMNNPNNDADLDDWADAHNPNSDEYLGD